jgi:hypothetical protein
MQATFRALSPVPMYEWGKREGGVHKHKRKTTNKHLRMFGTVCLLLLLRASTGVTQTWVGGSSVVCRAVSVTLRMVCKVRAAPSSLTSIATKGRVQ